MAININKIESIVNNMDNTRAINDQRSKTDCLIGGQTYTLLFIVKQLMTNKVVSSA